MVTDVLSVGFRSEWNSTLLARIRRGNQNESLENRRIRLAEPQCATESRKGKVTKILRPKQQIAVKKIREEIAQFRVRYVWDIS